MKAKALAIFGALALGGFNQAEAAIECAGKFDLNGNGVVEVGSEVDICILHKASPTHQKFDKNLNGRIDATELASLEAGARTSDAYVTLSVDVSDQIGSKAGLEPSKKNDSDPPNTDRFNVKGGLLLRKAYEAPSVIKAPTDNLAKVAGADFTFSHDERTNVYSVASSGAVFAYRHWDLNALSEFNAQRDVTSTILSGAAVNVGAEFNHRKVHRSPSRKIDSLILRAGGELEFTGPWASHYVRANFFDSTDFDLTSHVIGGSVEYEPVVLDLGIGVARQITGVPVYFRWRPVAHAEFLHVADAGRSATLAAQSDRSYAGAIINAELFFGGPLERLYFDTTYWQMFNLTGGAPGFDYLQVGANWGLDEAGHFALTAKYRTGNLPKTFQKVEDITVGLAAKF